jgi:hypothetical protein
MDRLMNDHKFLLTLARFQCGLWGWFTVSIYHWKPYPTIRSNIDSKVAAVNPIRVKDIPFPLLARKIVKKKRLSRYDGRQMVDNNKNASLCKLAR